MMAENHDADEGLFPEPDPAQTLRLIGNKASGGWSRYRRLVRASLVSLGFHLLLMTVLLLITVVFSNNLRFSDDAFDYYPNVGNNPRWEMDVADAPIEVASERMVAAGNPAATKSQPEPASDQQPEELPPSPILAQQKVQSPEDLMYSFLSTHAGKGADSVARQSQKRGGGPPIPMPPWVVSEMLRLPNMQARDVVYDLGCGDGRILVAAAKLGATAYGCDSDPERVNESFQNVKKNNLQNRVTVEHKSIFDADLSQATVVVLHLLPSMLEDVKPQLEKLTPGSRIVCFEFPLEGIEADRTIQTWWEGARRAHDIYIYVTPMRPWKSTTGNGEPQMTKERKHEPQKRPG
jgi:SAM-dependent methyltransferase